ncbi:MAG: hypothetical protein HGA67_04435 [Candidatus Yonathbacteria bacterium]|nr:hypothetical protein [Candidatus Yonathbacteria bacterium]
MPNTNRAPVFGRDGKPLHIGSIVSIPGIREYFGVQGLVVETSAETEQNICAVAVYFDIEVPMAYEEEPPVISLEEWRKKHTPKCPDILFTTYLWQQCPRVRYFHPEHVVFEPHWSIETLAKRTFPGDIAYSWMTPLPENRIDTGIRDDLPCGIDGCLHRATTLALVNVWGIIRPINMCPTCHSKHHGRFLNELPSLKEHEDVSIAS